MLPTYEKRGKKNMCSLWRGENTMNKTELVSAVAESAELSKKDATKAVDAVFDAIQDALKSGDKVQLIGFGNFEVRERSARKGRNPQTGEEIEIAASKVPAFKPGKALKEAVN
jgi:DNA-binding protein HU-beta